MTESSGVRSQVGELSDWRRTGVRREQRRRKRKRKKKRKFFYH
ncbi:MULTISPECIES: hypothetical protein [Okeania]|nr:MULTISPECIES: hypothetical protein [Okeania]